MNRKAPKRVAVSSSSPSKAAKKETRSGSLLQWCSRRASLCFALAAAAWVLALYWNAFKAPFVYDDLEQILNNPALASWRLTIARFFFLPVAFTNDFLGGGGFTYRPLYWLTFALDRQLWGATSVSGFHFTSLLLHWANGLLLFQLLRRIKVSTGTAAISALLWLGLPINTEAVVWISARAYLLSSFFLLLGLLSASLYLRRDKRTTLVCYFLFSLAAVFSHEQGFLLLPLTLFLIYGTRRDDRATWVKLAGTGLAANLFCAGIKYWVGAHGGGGPRALWSIGEVFWKYLLWMLAPIHMSVERSTSLPADSFSTAAVAAWLLLFAFAGTAVLLRRRAPLAATGMAWISITLLPFCGFVFIYQGMAERFLYIASMGLALAIVSLAQAGRRQWKQIALAGLLLWMAWGALRLRARVLDWDDPVSLYESSLQATPTSAALYYNLGFSLREQGDLDRAIVNYRQAIRLRPTYQRAFASIAEIYAKQNKPAEALTEYSQALKLQPDDTNTVINYAVALGAAGKKELAEQQFKVAIAQAPKQSAAFIDLGNLYVQEDREDEAIQCFEKAIAKNPNDPLSYFDMGVLFQRKGRDDLALPFYKKVLRLKPDDPETLLYMSQLHVSPESN
jgi:protein O-mannosyl-transferase